MGDFRVVVRHVRYWRGAVHKWSTVYPLTGSLSGGNYAAVIAAAYAGEQAVNYKGPVATGGGVYEIALYNQASGGVPIALTTYFPWATPGSWLPYTGSGYGSNTFALEPQAEVALQVEWLAGLSVSGKPVSFKKWYHSVPQTGSIAGVVDITSAQVTSLSTALTTMTNAWSALGVPIGNSSRLAALSPTVRQYFGNHQMPKGRRKKVAGSGGLTFSEVSNALQDLSALANLASKGGE